MRAPDPAKQHLLGRFVDSVPCYRKDGATAVSYPSAAKFYRYARATCAMDQRDLRPQPPAGSPVVLGLVLRTRRQRRVSIRVLEGRAAEIWREHAVRVPTGQLLRCDRRSAIGALRVQQGRVVLSDARGYRPHPKESLVLAQFWQLLCTQLRERRHVPLHALHLHLGEAAFRWNHPEQDLRVLLERSMRSLPLSKVAPLVRNR